MSIREIGDNRNHVEDFDLIQIEDPIEIRRRAVISHIQGLCDSNPVLPYRPIGYANCAQLPHSQSTPVLEGSHIPVAVCPHPTPPSTSFNWSNFSLEELDPYSRKPAATSAVEERRPEEEASPASSLLPPSLSGNNEWRVVEGLKYTNVSLNDFSKEVGFLKQFCQELFTTNTQQDFQAPAKDYMTTSADCIKLAVLIDEKVFPDCRPKLEFTCQSMSTCEEILTEVLLRILPQNTLDENDGIIPVDDYVLRVFGTEEILPKHEIIGRFSFVGLALSHDQDVKLALVPSVKPIPKVKRALRTNLEQAPILFDHFDTFVKSLFKNVAAIRTNHSDKIAKHNIVQSLKMIQTYTCYTQPAAFTESLELFASSNELGVMTYSIDRVLKELWTFFEIYCRSSPTDFTICSADSAGQKTGPTRELMNCNDVNCEFILDSLHNVPFGWIGRYSQLFVEVELIHGVQGLGVQRTSGIPVRGKNINIGDLIRIECPLSKYPREVRLSFVVVGETNGDLQQGAQDEPVQVFLASGSLPVFNADGYLVDGTVLLGLNKLVNGVVHPWGARSLLRNQEDPVLRITFVDCGKIKFPDNISYNKIRWMDFASLNKADQEFATRIVDNSSVHLISRDEKEFLWSKRAYLRHLPQALPLILNSCFSWDCVSVGHIYALLDDWTELPPELALELLLPYFPDTRIRCKAVKWFSSASPMFCFKFAGQLVEALRFETYEDSELAKFLLKKCTTDKSFAFEIYWQLQLRADTDSNVGFQARCKFLQERLLWLGIVDFESDVLQQKLFLKAIVSLNKDVKEAPETSLDIVLRQGLRTLQADLDVSRLRIPLFPAFKCNSIEVNSCGCFNSFTKPIRLCFQGEHTHYSVIFKMGDDLRQDAVVLQLVGVMDDIWHRNGLDLRLIVFRCLPMATNYGFIELVPKCRTLREIQVLTGATGVFRDDVINSWLQANNPSELQYRAAMENFRRSCAGWCVATYLLGIGDRHNDNIVITTNGHVFHIDFGKYMGEVQMAGSFKRDRVPFVLTPEMVYVINQGKQISTEHFQKFIDECCQAFNLVRRNSALLLNAMRFMSCSDIPGLNNSAQQFVENNLFLHLNDVDATVSFTRLIQDSLNSVFPRLNFFAHTLAQLGLTAAFGGVVDPDHMSFIQGLFTESQDGRIVNVTVVGYEKWKVPEKVYMFKCVINRQDVVIPDSVYRAYDEFVELQFKLRCRFPRIGFASLGRGLVVGRRNVHSVAAVRQIELQQFLHMLFDLPREVSHCDLVYTFFHTTFRDEAPEEHRNKLNGGSASDPNQKTQLFLRLAMDFKSSKLTIFVGHARKIPVVNKLQEPDTYVKTYLRKPGLGSDRDFKRKTIVVQKSSNPTFNYELNYLLNSFDLDELARSSLDVSIWFSSYLPKDNFKLCEINIPLSCFNKTNGVNIVEKWFRLE